MSPPLLVASPAGELTLADLRPPLELDALLPGGEGWEVEIGFGKGRYLLRRAAAEPRGRFLGIEVASKYFRLAAERARRRGLGNLLLLRGEAEGVLTSVLPRGFARAVHVYFPDPWPKSKHQRRRLLDAESVDLVLGLLRPGGVLWFATDFLAYGERVAALLAAHPRAQVRLLADGWPEGARTNYEAKYVAAGRPILRLQVTWEGGEGRQALHPDGVAGLVSAYLPTVGPPEGAASEEPG